VKKKKPKPPVNLTDAAVDLYVACLEVLDQLGDEKCPLCWAYVADEGHDETCAGHIVEKAVEKARGEKP
jgi:hypothetical protein